MAYRSGVVSVGATPTLICTVSEPGALLQNLGSVVVTLGGPNVVAGSGPSLAATQTAPVFVPGARSDTTTDTADIYGIVASTTSNVAFAAPTGG